VENNFGQMTTRAEFGVLSDYAKFAKFLTVGLKTYHFGTCFQYFPVFL